MSEKLSLRYCSLYFEYIISLTLQKFENIREAEDALYYLDRVVLHGRELEVQFAEGDRKSRS